MNDAKIKTIPEEEVVKRVADILKRAIESGDVSIEDLKDENFARNVASEYIKLKNAKAADIHDSNNKH